MLISSMMILDRENGKTGQCTNADIWREAAKKAPQAVEAGARGSAKKNERKKKTNMLHICQIFKNNLFLYVRVKFFISYVRNQELTRNDSN